MLVIALCTFMIFGGRSFGLSNVAAAVQTTSPDESPTSSPTTTPEPTGPAVVLLNPAAVEPIGPPLGETQPILSDKNDGYDTAYHVVAVTRQAPAQGTVEAFWNGVSIGTLARTADSPDTWELLWDIPETLSGSGTISVKLFNASSSEIATDSRDATIDHNEEAVEMSWPTNGGTLGFFKSHSGPWRGVIEGRASQFAQRLYFYYTTTPVGTQPVWQGCGGAANTFNPPAGGQFRPFAFTCVLNGKDTPSMLTAVTVISAETDNPVSPGASGALTNESGDAHRITGTVQRPEDMKIAIAPVQPATRSAAYPAGDVEAAGNDCMEFDLTVLDNLDRPVQGANVDIHLQGPSDPAGFGDEGDAAGGSSADKPPDAGGHDKDDAWDCDSPGDHFGVEGVHINPNGDNVKHDESTTGTGVSGPSAIKPGQFRFHVFSPDPGRTKITAWVDEPPLKKETGVRAADNDKLGTDEATDTLTAQWTAGPTRVIITPASGSAVINTCHPYTIAVRGGRTRVEGINLDLHATGPADDLDFCDPQGASLRRAPDAGDHSPEDAQEAQHPAPSGGTSTQHTEGETDDAGEFIVGLTSTVAGDTTIQGWVDGTRGQDNDTVDTGEPSATATLSWAAGADQAQVHFINPSGYGDGAGDDVSNADDGNNFFHVLARVDLPGLVTGVDLLISSDGTSFSKIGSMTRVGSSDTYEFPWVTSTFAADTYTLRAQIVGTEQVEDRQITLDNSLNTVELHTPGAADIIPFVDRKAHVAGVASAGAARVDLYYTTTGARDRRDPPQWVQCGSTTLAAPGDAPQQFDGECTLADGDEAAAVSGLAAIASFCDDIAGCPEDTPLGSVTGESGDAHRVFGLDSTPIVSMDPEHGQGAANSCQKVVVSVEDESGGPVPNSNVDIHLDGPGTKAHFCTPEGTSQDHRAPTDGGHSPENGHPDEAKHNNNGVVHTEGETGGNGRLVIGIRSSKPGVSEITAWADVNDDDLLGQDESSALSDFQWGKGSRCTKTGTAGDDVLIGTRGTDVLCGLGGNDVIRGKGGNDRIFGGGGKDILRGDAGADLVHAGAGDDSVVGGGSRDKVFGEGGQDVISGKGSRDTLHGGSGNDDLSGGGGHDSCFGEGGNDRFRSCERQRQ